VWHALRERGFDLPVRAFVPHVTLARHSTGLAGADLMTPIIWPVTAGVLVASERTHEGAHYRVLKRWPATV